MQPADEEFGGYSGSKSGRVLNRDLRPGSFHENQEIECVLDESSICQVLKHAEELQLSSNSLARRIQLSRLPQIPVEIPMALREVAFDSITGALECLDCVEATIPSLAMDFLDTPGLEAFQNLLQLYGGLYWITALVDKLTASFHMNLEDVLLLDVSVLEHQQKLISILKRLMESQEKKDFALIPGLLQGEIAALVPVWKEMFRLIWKRLEPAQSLCERPVTG
jgi:hypothetical protein